MRNRCILSLLACAALLYFALPRLSLYGTGLETYFSWAWLLFMFMVIAGNLAAILYLPRQNKQFSGIKKEVYRQKSRSY